MWSETHGLKIAAIAQAIFHDVIAEIANICIDRTSGQMAYTSILYYTDLCMHVAS